MTAVIDRRIFAAVLVVVVVGFGLRSATTADTADQSESAASISESRAPLPVTAGAATGGTPTSVVEQPPSPSTTVPITAVALPDTIEQAEVKILVDSRRPTIDATEPPEDGHHDDGELMSPAGQPVPDTEQIAATVVVTGWTWRYDDSDTRQAEALEPVASPALVALLVPSTEELQRRVENNEVSWVIIRDIAVSDNKATVSFDQHLVTSSTAETVVARTVAVTTAVGLAVEVAL